MSTVVGSTTGGRVEVVTHTANAEIVSPDLTPGGLLQKGCFEGGFAINAYTANRKTGQDVIQIPIKAKIGSPV